MFWYLTKSVRNISTLTAVFLFCSACVYRLDIQQGNLLDDSQIEQVEVGMSRSQVQFLLGTPMVNDSFHQDRWDYTYYLNPGRSRDIERRWFIVFFQEDSVARLERDAILTPTSPGTRRQEPGVVSRAFSRLRQTEEADVRETPELPAAQESPAPVDAQTVGQESGVLSRVFSRFRRTEEADVLELPAAQESPAPVNAQTNRLDENRSPPTTPATQIEANVELLANPIAEPSASEVESNLPAAQESPAPVDAQTVGQESGVLSRVFSRFRRTEEADVLELPAAQESPAPVNAQTVRLDENRSPSTTPATQIEANVELLANPDAEPSASEVESNLPSESQRLVEVENANTSTGEGWVVQLGSFSEEENARRLADRAATFGFTTRVSTYTTSSGLMFRVRVGPGLSRDRAMDIASSLSANGFVAQAIIQD